LRSTFQCELKSDSKGKGTDKSSTSQKCYLVLTNVEGRCEGDESRFDCADKVAGRGPLSAWCNTLSQRRTNLCAHGKIMVSFPNTKPNCKYNSVEGNCHLARRQCTLTIVRHNVRSKHSSILQVGDCSLIRSSC
jgi:hypothetical protein